MRTAQSGASSSRTPWGPPVARQARIVRVTSSMKEAGTAAMHTLPTDLRVGEETLILTAIFRPADTDRISRRLTGYKSSLVAPGAGHDTDEGGERRDAEHEEDLVPEAAQLAQGRVLAVQHGAGEEVLEAGGS